MRSRSGFLTWWRRGAHARSRFGGCNFFFADFLAQFSVGRKESPVSYGKTVLLLSAIILSFD
jgi:hypothetical protein